MTLRVAVQLSKDHTIGEAVNKLRKTKYWLNVYKDIVFVSMDFTKDTNMERVRKTVEEDLLYLGLLADYSTVMEIH